MKNRRQRVVINGEYSDWVAVLSGVPQGSVLGPLLFLIYINNLDDEVKVRTKKFADDTKIYAKAKTNSELQHSLNNLFNWAPRWEMPFNMENVR